jgi:hypothetical protein
MMFTGQSALYDNVSEDSLTRRPGRKDSLLLGLVFNYLLEEVENLRVQRLFG